MYVWYVYVPPFFPTCVSQPRHGRLEPLLRLLRQRGLQPPPQRAAALLVALAVEDVENGEKTRKDVDFLRKNGLKW